MTVEKKNGGTVSLDNFGSRGSEFVRFLGRNYAIFCWTFFVSTISCQPFRPIRTLLLYFKQIRSVYRWKLLRRRRFLLPLRSCAERIHRYFILLGVGVWCRFYFVLISVFICWFVFHFCECFATGMAVTLSLFCFVFFFVCASNCVHVCVSFFGKRTKYKELVLPPYYIFTTIQHAKKKKA